MSAISEIREQKRQDAAAAAEQKRLDAEATAQRRRQDAAHQDGLRQQRADARRTARQARFAALRGWVTARPVELLMSLIVVVPAVLAWQAMAVFGIDVYGPVGVALPLFSEAAMWAFAFALHIARRNGRPTGWLQVGLWVFTAVAGVLNFLHGLVRSVIHGLVMATVATGGVVAHQLITAAPMRTRRSREQRLAERRLRAMRLAALRQAAGQLSEDGSVELIHAPGTVTLARSWWTPWRRRLVPTAVPGQSVAPVSDELDAEIAALLDEASEPAGTAQTPGADDAGDASGTNAEHAEHLAEIRRAIAVGELGSEPSRRDIQRHLKVRAITAQRIHRAVLGRGDDNGTAGVAA